MAAVEQPPSEPAGAHGRVVHLDDGGSVTIRSIEPADAYPLLRMFDRLSPNQLLESITESDQTGSHEQATYVVSQDPSTPAQIVVEMTLIR